MLKINSIYYKGSLADGPGFRTIVFLQGCETHCKGCHNSSTWDINKGNEIDVKDLAKELRTKVENKKITISGGEPLLQYEELVSLLQELSDFDICLYTCHELDDVKNNFSAVLPYLRYIKVGRYEENLRTSTKPYVGSTNQKFYKIEEGNVYVEMGK